MGLWCFEMLFKAMSQPVGADMFLLTSAARVFVILVSLLARFA